MFAHEDFLILGKSAPSFLGTLAQLDLERIIERYLDLKDFETLFPRSPGDLEPLDSNAIH